MNKYINLNHNNNDMIVYMLLKDIRGMLYLFLYNFVIIFM